MGSHMTAEQLRGALAKLWREMADFRCAGSEMTADAVHMYMRDYSDQLRTIAARLSGMAAAPQWQPIETAPRDSRKVLVGSFNVYGEWRTYMAWWRLPYEGAPDNQCSWCYDKDGTLLDASIHSCGATHWQPLHASPEPPHG